MVATRCLLLLALVALSSSTPVDKSKAAPAVKAEESLSEADSDKSVASARESRDYQGGGGHGGHGGGGLHGGGGHHGGGGLHGGGGGGGGGGGHHDVGGGYQAVGHVSNHIGGSGSGGYSAPAPQPSYSAPTSHHQSSSSYAAPAAPAQQTGYYYYYYPVQIQDDKKSKDGGFMNKMKKLFEPMMYPWTAMMDYFGYSEDYDYDYDYDSYGQYARSMVSRASEYVPWDSVNEIGNVVTQDQCVEFFVCQLGSYGREYNNLHILLEYLLPDVDSNSYTRSFKDSVLKKTDCDSYSCPIVRRAPLITEDV